MSRVQDITSKLWAMANKLRGTMDASEYKNYILPFMFYRYLSENQDSYLKENDLEEFYSVEDDEIEDYLDEISRGIGYSIRPEYRWEEIVSKIEDYKINASFFADMFDSFNDNAKRNPVAESDFANVFSDVNLGDSRLGSSTNERAKALNDIVIMINDFEFKSDDGHDILGDVYEYLIGQFAANAGKKGGEFYTPHQVSQVLAKLVTLDTIDDGNQLRVYDPTMGSATTAHATLELNKTIGGNRRFIMVQVPENLIESVDKSSGKEKKSIQESIDFLRNINKPLNLCELGKERIRRAGKKILEENKDKEGIENLDVGFRVLKLDSSNMKDTYYTPQDTQQSMLEDLTDNIKEDRSELDLLFQVMLDLGVELSSTIDEIDISGKKIFSVADNYLLATFDKDIDDEIITEIAKKRPVFFVMRDASLTSDSVATNFEQIFNTYSPETTRRVL